MLDVLRTESRETADIPVDPDNLESAIDSDAPNNVLELNPDTREALTAAKKNQDSPQNQHDEIIKTMIENQKNTAPESSALESPSATPTQSAGSRFWLQQRGLPEVLDRRPQPEVLVGPADQGWL